MAEYNAIPKLVLTGTYRSTERAEQHQKRIDRKITWFEELMGRIDNRFTQVGEAVANVTSSETHSAVDKVKSTCQPPSCCSESAPSTHYLRNPAGLEELSRSEGDQIVKVVVFPKRFTLM
jgi:hypothetical protein